MIPGASPSKHAIPLGQTAQTGLVLESDPVIEAYKKGVDRTLIRAQLLRSVDDRVRVMMGAAQFADALRGARRVGTQP
jgi:hypothetical protein